MLSANALVVVADGHSAHLYRNHGHTTIDLSLMETITPDSMSNDGPAGAVPMDQSLRDLEEATFIKLLVRRLNEMALANKLPDEVVVIADPTSLGQMRPLYHGELKRRIVQELAKTLVKATPDDLAKALAKAA